MAKLSFDDVKFWLDEIESCKERQRLELISRNQYPLVISYYEGEMSRDQNEQTPTTTDRIKKLAMINEYFPNVNSLIAEIMFQTPEITAKPLKPTADPVAPGMQPINLEDNAEIMKSAITYGYEKYDFQTENKIGLFDKILAGYSAIEVNHITERPPTQATQKESKSLVESVKGLFKTEEQLEKDLPPKELSEVKDETFVRRWNPLDILLDWRAGRIRDLRYIIKITRMSQAEFKAKYPNFAGIASPDHPLPFSKHKRQEHSKAITVYEIQQKKKDKYETFMITPSVAHQEIDWFERPYTTNGFNIKIGVLHQYGVLYPVSFGKINKALQDDINNYVTHMMEVAERNIPKRGYNVNKVNEDTLTKARNSKVNEYIPFNGGPESVWAIPHTNVSVENKELLAIFKDHKQKLWGRSEARLEGGAPDVKFAEQLKTQEAGFATQNIDIQEGLRRDIKAQLNTLKDIIVTFWDQPMWFKITGAAKPTWYVPDIRVTAEGKQILINPLPDILTRDYEVDLDISTALKPNKDRRKAEVIEYLTWLAQTAAPILQLHGKIISLDAIEKTAKDFGLNPKSLLVDLTPEQQQLLAASAEGGKK